MTDKPMLSSITHQRRFTMVYNDFLESDKLDCYEKMVFIALKRYADSETNKCFPSLKTLHTITGISTRKIQDVLKSLEEKKILEKKHRFLNGGYTSNEYILRDEKWMWKPEDGKQDEQNTVSPQSEQEMIAYLRSKGYKVKEPESKTLASVDSDSELNQFDIYDNTSISDKSQQKCVKYKFYEKNDIWEQIGYQEIINEHPEIRAPLDTIVDMMFDTINHPTSLTINGIEKPAQVVKSQFLKLEKEEILMVLKNYIQQDTKITNVRGYILSMLYNAEHDYRLHWLNKQE